LNSRFVFAMLVALLALLALSQGCGRSEPPQLPRSVPADGLYQFLADEYASNSTRLQLRIEERQLFSILLVITNIDENKVQQHLRKPALEMDSYVECEFKNREQVRQLNKGNTIEVYGFLKDAFAKNFGLQNNAVKLGDCHYVT